MTSPLMNSSSKAGWINAVLIPVKQHALCCFVLPPLVSTLFGANATEMLHTLPAEIAIGTIVPPVVTYATMAAEQAYHQWKSNCVCTHKTLTKNNYLKQTALSYLFYAATAVGTHFLFPHNHDHETPHHGQGILNRIKQKHHHIRNEVPAFSFDF